LQFFFVNVLERSQWDESRLTNKSLGLSTANSTTDVHTIFVLCVSVLNITNVSGIEFWSLTKGLPLFIYEYFSLRWFQTFFQQKEHKADFRFLALKNQRGLKKKFLDFNGSRLIQSNILFWLPKHICNWFPLPIEHAMSVYGILGIQKVNKRRFLEVSTKVEWA